MGKILIMGAAGNMGRRYAAIFNYFNLPFYSYDIREYSPFKNEIKISAPESTQGAIKSAIICTRTEMHSVVIDELQEIGFNNFLIEKPMFSKSEDYQWAKRQSYSQMRMVCNYKFIDGPGGETYYNYYHSGSEEPWSNLIQLIGLERSHLKIETTSPIWKCILNGRTLTLEDVHRSYILMIKQWIKDPTKLIGIAEAEKWFRKAKNWQESPSVSKQEFLQGDFLTRSSMSSSQDLRSSTPALSNVIPLNPS